MRFNFPHESSVDLPQLCRGAREMMERDVSHFVLRELHARAVRDVVRASNDNDTLRAVAGLRALEVFVHQLNNLASETLEAQP